MTASDADEITVVMGLYRYIRGGVLSPKWLTPAEVERSLVVNPWYADRALFLAGDGVSARTLEGFGLTVHRVFDDAPDWIVRDTAHLMKHWMCLWALTEHGGFLWLDWDTVSLKRPDADFVRYCRSHDTPKFVRIPDYWATVNCGVYSAPASWVEAMREGFDNETDEPNDELLWASVLPSDVTERPEFWWEDRVVHVESKADLVKVTTDTYFAHVRDLALAEDVRAKREEGAVQP